MWHGWARRSGLARGRGASGEGAGPGRPAGPRPGPVREGRARAVAAAVVDHPLTAGASNAGRPEGDARGGRPRLAFLVDDLNGGGVQRMTLALVRECLRRGHAVDLLACRPEGALRVAVPDGARLVPLRRGGRHRARLLPLAADPGGMAALLLPVLLAPEPDWTLGYLAGLAAFLRRERPDALLTATPRLNLAAVWARRLAKVDARLLLSERTAPSQDLGRGRKWRKRFLPRLM